MTSQIKTMIETFEKWHKETYDKAAIFKTTYRFVNGEYQLDDIQLAWETWQAAIDQTPLTKRIVVLEAALYKCQSLVEDTSWGYDGDCGSVSAINAIVDEAIKEASQ